MWSSWSIRGGISSVVVIVPSARAVTVRGSSAISTSGTPYWRSGCSSPSIVARGRIGTSWAATASAIIVVITLPSWIPRVWGLSPLGEALGPHRVYWMTSFEDDPLIVVYRYSSPVEVLVP